MRDDERQALSLLAFVLLQNGRPEKAAALMDALDAVLPAHPPTLKTLAVAQLRSGQATNALQTLDRLELLGESEPLLDLLRAQALAASGQRSEAEVAMAHFLQQRQEMTP